MGRLIGQWVFFPMISYGARRILCKKFPLPPAMSYDKLYAVLKLNSQEGVLRYLSIRGRAAERGVTFRIVTPRQDIIFVYSVR